SLEIRRSATLSARLLSGGTAPYTSQILSGGLPGGLVLNPDGTVSGSPAIAAPFTSSIKWTDAVGQTGTVTLNVLVTAPPLVASTVPPLSVSVGQSVTQPLVVQGGTPPYRYTLSSGALPSGVSLMASGVLQGTPTAGGSYSGVVTVGDGTIPQQTIAIPVSAYVSTASVVAHSDVSLNTMSAMAYGVHTSVYDDAIGDISGEAPKIATAGTKVLRFPGGSYSDRYHWAQHALTPNFAPFDAGVCATIWNGYMAANSDFGNFVRLLNASGTTGMVTVNYGTSVADAAGTKSVNWNGETNCSAPNMGGQPQEAAAWVAYANGDASNTQSIGRDAVGFDWKTVGYWASLRASQPLATDDGLNFLRLGVTAPIGIKYWEIGNELYYNGYNSILTETDLHAPFTYSNGYDKDPDSRMGVTALSPTSYGTGAAAFANAMHAVDATIQVGVVVGSDIDPVPSTWTSDVLTAACSAAKFDFAIVHYYPGTYNAVTTDELLSNPQGDLPGIVKGIQAQTGTLCGNATMPVFMTETNPNGSLASTVPDAAVALFAAHDLLTAFEAGMSNAEWLELHGGAGTFLTEAEVPGSAYYGFQLAHLTADAGDALVQVTSSSSSLLVHAAKKTNGKLAVMLLNRSATDTAFVNV
ncbi:MAG: putative Ig domain-containing protein, partial [Terriglobus sp.]